MGFDPKKVRESYSKKIASYESKYNFGYYTHVHTGLYEKSSFPLIANAKVDQLHKLGISKIRHYLHLGQESLINRLLSKGFYERQPRNVLDCGAGHGGTSLYIADNFSLPVCALTVSDEQTAIIERRAIESGNSHLISNKCDNIFDTSFETLFTHIVGVDAFCQMGNPAILFKKLNSFLEPSGLVLVSDYFVERKTSEIAEFFNSYWASDITTIEETVESAFQAGLTLQHLSDITQQQIPFWNLSIAHSNILLQKIQDNSERKRLEGSKVFHSAMKSAFHKGYLAYKQIIFKKRC